MIMVGADLKLKGPNQTKAITMWTLTYTVIHQQGLAAMWTVTLGSTNESPHYNRDRSTMIHRQKQSLTWERERGRNTTKGTRQVERRGGGRGGGE